MSKSTILVIFGVIFAFLNLNAQEKDSTELKIEFSESYAPAGKGKIKNPKVASWLSCALPGAGQVYNGKYWKVPIVYTALGGTAYLISQNNYQYHRFLDAYVASTDEDSLTISEFEGIRPLDNVEHFKDQYHRSRDLSIIFFAGLYILNIIDASVDAHFSDFDISDDLSLYYRPDYYQIKNENYYGLTIGLNFK